MSDILANTKDTFVYDLQQVADEILGLSGAFNHCFL